MATGYGSDCVVTRMLLSNLALWLVQLMYTKVLNQSLIYVNSEEGKLWLLIQISSDIQSIYALV